VNDLEALAEALSIVQQSIDSQPLPGGHPTPCTEFGVAALVEHINWTHGLLLEAIGGDAVELEDPHDHISAAALAAWTARGVDGSISIGGNDLPAAFGLSLHVLETYVHGWDLAAALGRPFTPSTELTERARSAAEMIITDEARGPDGPYGPAVQVDADADDVAHLIAFTGRDPAWSADGDG
jgi:uncharacterized protein (TIGR03086 family)